MAGRYDPTDYLYASARLRARESDLLALADPGQPLPFADRTAILEALVAGGIPHIARADGTPDFAAMLEAFFGTAVKAVRESAPDPSLTLPFSYPYDCNNIKTLEKCRIRGISPDGRLSPLGSVPTDRLTAAFEGGTLQEVLPTLAAGLDAARTRYAKSGNPRDVDLCLDAAAFAAMASAAAPFPFAAALVAERVDIVNLLSFCRLLEGGEVERAIFNDAFLSGGTLPQALFEEHWEKGTKALSAALRAPRFLPLLAADSIAAREACADRLLFDFAEKAKSIPFGVEVPIAYLLKTELTVKRLRLAVAQQT